MKIGTVEAELGEKAFGFLTSIETRGRFQVQVPFHLIQGASEGPVLVVQSGLSGLELEGALMLPRVVKELDPASIAGTVVVVPLMNMSGFEFEQRNVMWDNKDLNALGRGRPDGSVSEKLVHDYYEQVISRASALVDLHNGETWGYFGYAGVYETGDTDGSLQMATSIGLPQVLRGQPEDQSMAFEAAKDGKKVVSAWIGGGPGLRDYREKNEQRIRNTVLNAMKHLGMMESRTESDTDSVSIIKQHTVLTVSGERGLTFMDKAKRCRQVKVGEELGYVRHPYSGQTVNRITAPRDGLMLDAGATWPILPDYAVLAILGDVVAEVRVT